MAHGTKSEAKSGPTGRYPAWQTLLEQLGDKSIPPDEYLTALGEMVDELIAQVDASEAKQAVRS